MAIIITMSNKSTRCTVQAASVQRLLRFENSQRQLEKNSKLETASMQPRSEQRQLISRDSSSLFFPDDWEVIQVLDGLLFWVARLERDDWNDRNVWCFWNCPQRSSLLRNAGQNRDSQNSLHASLATYCGDLMLHWAPWQ